ncbi:MAG: thioesterase family protein [Gemmatimonas sp.]
MTTPHPFLVSDRVRWADVDLVGIMRYSAFTRLVELAEQELMRAAGWPYSRIFEAPTMMLPRRHFSIEYFAPVRLDDELSLVTYVSHIGESSLTYSVDVRTAEWTLVASAATVVVCVGFDTFIKQRLPDELREALAPFACTTDVARTWTRAST